jgi:hypothetical protein
MERDIKKIERHENIMQSDYLIKTIEFEPKNIYSLRQKMSLKDFEEAFGRLFAGLGKNRLRPAGPCLSVYHGEEFNHECTDIEVGVVVQEKSEKISAGLIRGFAALPPTSAPTTTSPLATRRWRSGSSGRATAYPGLPLSCISKA